MFAIGLGYYYERGGLRYEFAGISDYFRFVNCNLISYLFLSNKLTKASGFVNLRNACIYVGILYNCFFFCDNY